MDYEGEEELELILSELIILAIGVYLKIKGVFTRGKNPDQPLCEDGIFIVAEIVAATDGATSYGTLSGKCVLL